MATHFQQSPSSQESCCLRSPFCIEFLHFTIFWALHISIDSPTQMALVVTGFLRSDVHPNPWTQYQTARSPSGQSWLPQRLSASWQTKTIHWGLHPCRFQSQTPSKSNNSRALVAATQPRDAAPAAFEEPQIATLLGRSAIRMLSRQSFEFATHGGWIKPWQWPMVTRVQMLSDLGKSWEMSPVWVKAVGQTPRKKIIVELPMNFSIANTPKHRHAFFEQLF